MHSHLTIICAEKYFLNTRGYMNVYRIVQYFSTRLRLVSLTVAVFSKRSLYPLVQKNTLFPRGFLPEFETRTVAHI